MVISGTRTWVWLRTLGAGVRGALGSLTGAGVSHTGPGVRLEQM